MPLFTNSRSERKKLLRYIDCFQSLSFLLDYISSANHGRRSPVAGYPEPERSRTKAQSVFPASRENCLINVGTEGATLIIKLRNVISVKILLYRTGVIMQARLKGVMRIGDVNLTGDVNTSIGSSP
jgi:hypothetical protein